MEDCRQTETAVREEIRELQIEKGEIDFELEPCGLSYPAEFNSTLIKEFVERFARMRGLSPHTDEEVLASPI